MGGRDGKNAHNATTKEKMKLKKKCVGVGEDDRRRTDTHQISKCDHACFFYASFCGSALAHAGASSRKHKQVVSAAVVSLSEFKPSGRVVTVPVG